VTIPAFSFTVSFITNGAPTGKDDLGNDTYSPTTQSVPGCMFAPGGSTEDVQGRDQVTDQPTVYAPTGTAVGAPDSVIVPGYGEYKVDGKPAAWPAHPRTGWQPSNSVVIKLKAVTG
jgi:hypothetical protein